MAEMFTDEETNKPFIVAGHDELIRALMLTAWHSVGTSMATLASMEARDSITPMEDLQATYTIARVEMSKLRTAIADAPAPNLAYPLNKAALDICWFYEKKLCEDDIGRNGENPPTSMDDPRVLEFVKLTIIFIEALMQCMEQTKGRKARAILRAFKKSVAEEFTYDEATD